MKSFYRTEIDGLRSIAILSVILYHAQIAIFDYEPFKGGFLGVDIFFVISGYLITYIILKELINTGSFSLKYFYEKRVRRIIPALILVMLVSLPFAWIYLMPSSFVDYSKSILYSLGFSSNFYFHYSGQQYGADNGFLKPFLHTWTLSVEEQFYILFPIILLITYKYFRTYLIHILIICFIISLCLADWGSRNHPSFNFYFLPTRAWELLAGSIIAYFEITQGHRSKNKKLNLILPLVGLILIGWSIIFFNDTILHPSFYTLLTVIGVSLIIWFSNKNEIVTKVLSTRVFVGIGLISYSLYLWHYPIFAFDKIIEFSQESFFKKIIICLAVVISSVISYYVIEKPARNRRYSFKILFLLLTMPVIFLVIFNFNIISSKGYETRLPKIFYKELLETRELLKNSDGKLCYNNKNGCKFNKSSKKKVYLIGDSHMGSLAFNLKNRVINNNYQFISFTLSGCLFYPEFNKVHIKTKKKDDDCNNNYFKKIIQTLSNEKNSIIILGGRFPLYETNYYFDNQEGGVEEQGDNKWSHEYVPSGKYDNILKSFKNEILNLSKNHKIILIYTIPETGWNISYKLLNSIREQTDLTDLEKYLVPKNYITTSYQVYKKRNKTTFDLLDSIQNDNVYRIYPHSLLCNTIIKNRCLTHDSQNIFYSDNNHPSISYANMINNLIIKKIEEIK